MLRMYSFVCLAVLCSVDLSLGRLLSSERSETGKWNSWSNSSYQFQPSSNRVKDRPELEGSGLGRLPYSDDEDFGESGSGLPTSGDGIPSGDGNVDIIIDELATTAHKPPAITTTTTSRPLSECETRLKTSKQVVGYPIPRCLANGDFDSLQCDQHPGSGDCWCSDLDGREIPGSLLEAPNVPDCEDGNNLSPCVHQLIKHMRGQLLGSFRPRCAVDGMFKRKQCHVSMCFCVDEATGRRKPGTAVNIPDTPDCDDDTMDVIVETTPAPKSINRDDNEENIDIDDWTEPNEIDPYGEDTDSMNLDVNLDDNNDDEDGRSTEDRNETGEKQGEVERKKHNNVEEASEIMTQPGILAGIIGGSVVLLLCLVLLVMFIVYRMRKKDEGSYPLDEPSRKPNYSYVRAPEREFYA